MGLFRFNDREGPGVSGDEPRKTGPARFLEVLSRDGWSLCKAGLLSLPGIIPWCIGVLLSVAMENPAVMAVGGAVGGAIAAPQVVGILDTALRALRDEPGLWWLIYRDAWKKNWRASLLPGAVFGLLYAGMVFTLPRLEGLPALLVFFAGAAAVFGVGTWLWPQLALYDMGLGGMLRNAALMLLRFPLRTLGAVVVQLEYWALMLLYFPYTGFLLPVTGLWLPLYVAVFLIYAPMNETFRLEAELREKRLRDGDPPDLL